MKAFLIKNLLVLVIGVAAVLALALPGPGVALKQLQLIPGLIVVIFLCQGLGIDARRFKDLRAYAALLMWGGLIAFVAAPALAAAAMYLLAWSPDDRLGFLLMCSMGPTLVSGVVIANQAGGEREGATLLTIALNLVAVVTIPFTLALLVGGSVQVDSWALLNKLLVLVLLPAVLGQVVRWRWPARVEAAKAVVKYLPVALLGCIIYLALSERAAHLAAISLQQVVLLALPALAVHYLLAGLCYTGARGLLRAPRARATAAAVVCSQKTLPVAIAVWSTEFAAAYPLALIAPIVFHLSQIYGDGLLAAWWARRQARREGLTEVAA
ncbi:MAG: bile acid:sodium symporter [Planctomycetota bacterium]|jgi:predicted Na+-dependent transporter|nr:bile acid:sodium symporter [Planctomycetota bacterium]